jgi:iron-sulfur cluster assembly accessory protein
MIKIEFDDFSNESQTCNLDLTESAKNKLKSVFKDKENSFLRLSVTSGGCNGFNYSFDIDTKQNDDDLEVIIDDLKVVIDRTSNNYVDGSTIDFVTELQASHFKVVNPNATSSCSCGTSFSI